METKICSKCNQELPVTEFHKNGFDRQGNQKYRGYCKKCANKQETERYHNKKAYVDNQRTFCAKCGEDRTYMLDFHHIDKSTKKFTIGRFKKGSLELIQQEIDKCVCLCANCHREFHFFEKEENITIYDYLGDQRNGSARDFIK